MTSPGNTTSVGSGTDNDRSPPSMQATGGNGGAQLTQSNAEMPGGDTPVQRHVDTAGTDPSTEATSDATSDATASNRTAQDTRSYQAGSTGTGLGAAEAGGSEDPFDMPKQ